MCGLSENMLSIDVDGNIIIVVYPLVLRKIIKNAARM